MTIDRDEVKASVRAHRLPKRKPANVSAEEWSVMVAEHERREKEVDDRLLASRSRAHARAADDGAGRCRWCGVALEDVTHDGVAAKSHPDVDACQGPPQKCEPCGYEWRPPVGRRAEACPKCGGIPAAARSVAIAKPMELKTVRRQADIFDEE